MSDDEYVIRENVYPGLHNLSVLNRHCRQDAINLVPSHDPRFKREASLALSIDASNVKLKQNLVWAWIKLIE